MKGTSNLIAALCCIPLAGCASTAVDGKAPAPSALTTTNGSPGAGGSPGSATSGRDTAPGSAPASVGPHTSAAPEHTSGAPGANPAQVASTQRITVALGSTCIVPGGTQTIKLSTPGKASVSFNTRYSDGKLGGDYGGVGIGTTDDAGHYANAWTVSAQAPLGTTTVYGGMSQSAGTWSTTNAAFTIAAHC